MIDPTIPDALREIVDRELESDEQIEWLGTPVPTYFTPAATAAFLFGIPWTAFAIFWTAGAAWGVMQAGAGLFSVFPLFGLPFILIGICMLSSPVWAYRKSFKTAYVITDRRAITFDGGWSTTIRSYPPEKLTDTYRREHRNGTGDVIIARRAWRDSDGDKHSEELGFLRIRDAQDVERRLKALAAQAIEPPVTEPDDSRP